MSRWTRIRIWIIIVLVLVIYLLARFSLVSAFKFAIRFSNHPKGQNRSGPGGWNSLCPDFFGESIDRSLAIHP